MTLKIEEIAALLSRIASGRLGAVVTSAGLLHHNGGSTWMLAGGWMVRVESDANGITAVTDARSPDGREWQWFTVADPSPLHQMTEIARELLWCRLVLLDPLPQGVFNRPERAIKARPNGTGISYKRRKH